ncbi:MAG: hypothetical protein ACK4KX_03195 [Parvibaculum sp.]|jgi:hypothetical protein
MATKRKSVSKRVATKRNGTLKKGYRYARGGRIVKAKAAPKRKPTRRRRR